MRGSGEPGPKAPGQGEGSLEDSWPDCSLRRLTTDGVRARALLHLESGPTAGVCSLPASIPAFLELEEEDPLSPSVLSACSGAAIWVACAFPPLWGWPCGL